MATLKMPTVEYLPAEIDLNDPPQPAPSEKSHLANVVLDGPIRAALASLLAGLEYAQDLQTTLWDFAVELSSLRRLKLSNNDLRWLHARGLIEHAIEIDSTGNSARAFRPRQRIVFGKRSCFVLTQEGAKLAREVHGRVGTTESQAELPLFERSPRGGAASPSPDPPAPHWDRDRHELRIGKIVVKRFTVPAFEQESILAAFEEQQWPSRIDDPFAGTDGVAGRLPETVRRLNHGHRSRLICFQCEGSGCVLWQYGQPAPTPSMPSPKTSVQAS
jgi:hypothetical protein